MEKHHPQPRLFSRFSLHYELYSQHETHSGLYASRPSQAGHYLGICGGLDFGYAPH